MHGVAHRGEIEGLAVTHAAHHGGPGVNADPDPQGRLELVAQRLAQLAHALDHGRGRHERLAATRGGALVHAEQRHHAVARELVDDPARLGDRAAHGLEVTIEEEDDVIGQPVLGQPREAAEVGEEHGDLPLLSVARAHLQGGNLGRQ